MRYRHRIAQTDATLPHSVRMTSTPHRLKDALSRSEAGSALLRRVQASQRAAAVIESECRAIVPEFEVARSGGCELRGTTLRVNAAHPAQVAKLRQAIPRLLRLLQQQGLDVIEIKIGVQPRALTSSVRPVPGPAAQPSSGRPAPAGRSRNQIESALKFARKLALTLPESALRTAAQRLAGSLTSRLARMRDSGEPRNQQHGEKQDP